jgi:hypothetical protein
MCEKMATRYIQKVDDAPIYPFDTDLLIHKQQQIEDYTFGEFLGYTDDASFIDDLRPVEAHGWISELLPEESPEDVTMVFQMHVHEVDFYECFEEQLTDVDVAILKKVWEEANTSWCMLRWMVQEREAGREPINTRQWMKFEPDDMHPLK